MVTGYTRREIKIFSKMAAHSFAEQLFPAVPVFRHSRVRIFFFQRNDIRRSLFVGGINAGAAGKEKSLDAHVARCLQQMRVDQHRQHAKRFVVLDKPHSAHVCGQVVNALCSAVENSSARREFLQVHLEILYVVKALKPTIKRLLVHRANVRNTVAP